MQIALTGISGFIGSVLARRLHESGHNVTGLVRSTSQRDHIEAFTDRFVVGEQADESAWNALLDGADCIIHNAFDWAPIRSEKPGALARHLESNLIGSIKLLHASAPRQFIFMSTIAVHHDMRPRWRGMIDEDHPTRPGGIYGAYKASVEAHGWAAHFSDGRHFSAVRPCAVYGIDPKLDRSIGYPIIEKIRSEQRFDKQGGGKFVHVDDVANATIALIGNESASGSVVNLADCYARWGDLAVMAAVLMDLEAEIDLSSPPQPKNEFTKDQARALGVELNRDHAGLREHLRELIARMDAR